MSIYHFDLEKKKRCQTITHDRPAKRVDPSETQPKFELKISD